MELSSFKRGLTFVLIAAFVLGGLIFINRIVLGDVFNKEEAQHALYGLWLCKDIKALDIGSFWHDTQRQMYWPFFHSWILSLFFLVFGASYISARLLSLLLFLATLVLMYFVGSHISEKGGWKIGLFSVFLALTSPFMVRFSSENTLEGLGALIFLGSFALYVYCEERKLTIDYVLLAFLVGLSIFTNYLYAYLMIPAFIVMTLAKLGPIAVEVSKLERRGEKAALPFFWWAYRKVIFLTVILILAGSWFLTSSFSRKIMLLLQAIFKYSGGEVGGNFWQGLVYYPAAIIKHYSFSPWLGLLMVAALFFPFIALNNRVLGKLYIFVWTILLLVTLTISTKAPQFIYIIAPFLYIIFAAFVYYGLKSYKKFAPGILIVIFLPTLISVPQLWSAYFPARPEESMGQVLNYFKQTVPPNQPLAASFNLQHLNPEVLAFHFSDWPAPVLADTIIGEEEMLREARYFLAVEVYPDLIPPGEILDDSADLWNSILSEKLKSGEIRECSQRSFNRLGLMAKIYEKVIR